MSETRKILAEQVEKLTRVQELASPDMVVCIARQILEIVKYMRDLPEQTGE